MTRRSMIGTAATAAAVAALTATVTSWANGGSTATAGAGAGTAVTSIPGQRTTPPPGVPHAMLAPVTGAAAAKAKAAALARYPGTVERVVKAPAGGYVVHVIRPNGSEVHVLVSAAFKVTGAETGGPHGPGGGPCDGSGGHGSAPGRMPQGSSGPPGAGGTSTL